MALEGKRINELTEVSKVDISSKLAIDTGGAEALSITLKNLIDSSGVGSVDIATTEKAGIVKPDGTTISVSSDGTISSSGSGFDFEGTKAEFDAAVAAGTITDDSVSLITDDVSGDNVATKAELQDKVSKAGDTMSGNLNLNARLTLGTYKDTLADIQFSGVGGSFYQFVNNSAEGATFLQIYDENARGLVLIKSDNSRPYYFDGTTAYRLLTTADLETLQTQINSLNTEVMGMLGRMNFNARVDFSLKHGNTYTVPSKGYLWINSIAGTGGAVYINGGLLATGIGNDSTGSA